MKLHYRMNAQEWKDLLDYLSEGGCHLINYPQTDRNGLFVDYKYALIEYDGAFFSLDASNWEFDVCQYCKTSPYEKQQSDYPRCVTSAEELLDYIQTQPKKAPLKNVPKQRIFFDIYKVRSGYISLWHLENRLAGYREKAILGRLERITTVQHTQDYHVLRFHSADGNSFDYETKSCRITG